MAVELVQETVSIPKESKDVKDCLIQLALDIKAKKSLTEISGDILPKLMAAVEGYSALGDEAKSAEEAVCLGLMAGQIGAAFYGSPASGN